MNEDVVDAIVGATSVIVLVVAAGWIVYLIFSLPQIVADITYSIGV